MYVYYNAHPKGFHVDDCVKRAISVTARMDYMEVQRELNRYKRASGAELFYSERNPHAYVERVLGAKRISFAHRKGIMRMTAAKFCKAYPKGRYILDMEGHWSACINGILIDTWDPGDEVVYAAYLVTPVNEKQNITLRFCYTHQRLSDDEINVTFYDGNGKFVSKTMTAEDAEIYTDSLKKRGYPDMTDREAWV